MNRRDTIKYLSTGCVITTINPLGVNRIINIDGRQEHHYASLIVGVHHPFAVPDNQKILFDWDYFAVGSGEKCAYLRLNDKIPQNYQEIRIRLTTAINIEKESKIEISIPTSEVVIGILDLKHSPVFQISELIVDKELLSEVAQYGIRLKQISEGKPVYFVSENQSKAQCRILSPHLFFVGNKHQKPKAQFLERLYSLDSLQEFGWMEGCVLDGLWQIHNQTVSVVALDTIKNHLSLFLGEGFDSGKINSDIQFRNYKISSIEATLPLAIIANLYPNHPILDEAESFWHSRLKAHGGITDYSITAEGSYTIAYPMAVLSKVLNKPDLAKMALQQLRIREKLVDSGNNYLRYYPDKNTRTYKNWARGIAWYLLGIIRTISILKDSEDISDLKDEFVRASNFALNFQKADGLWNCFIDDQSTIADTSGSAGIAAAIASGINEGFLSEDLKKHIIRTWDGLIPHLTADGLLSGVAQSNSGGEELQRSNYRVISQMGMGLMGQLYAYL